MTKSKNKKQKTKWWLGIGLLLVAVFSWSPEPAAAVEEPTFRVHPVTAAPVEPALLSAKPSGNGFSTNITPNDPLFGSQYGPANISLPSAWDSSRGSPVVKVGIIDTGINGAHEDLSGQVSAGYNFITNAPISAGANSDDNGHGTLVAGVIGAATDNGKGVAGANWSVQLVPLKVANAAGEASASAVTAAIRYAADNGIHIVNMSLGSPADFTEVRDAVAYAAARNVIMVASSGNNGSVVTDPATDCATVCYPAAYNQAIAVGSVGSTDVRSSFSNYGPELDLVAPGESVLTTNVNGSYGTATGTSLAAPFVAGTAALVRARFDTDPIPSYLQQLLQNEADKPAGMGGQNFHNQYGYGRINAARAVRIHTAWVSQNAYPVLDRGNSYQFEVILRNTGSSTWRRSEINLGTHRSRDRVPQFTLGSDWSSSNRVTLVETTVAPNATGTFRFTYTVPNTLPSGTYREYFQPVFDGVGWLEDWGIYWDVHVYTPAERYHAAWTSQNAYPTLLIDQSYQFELVLRNTGVVAWPKGTVNLGTDRDPDRIPAFTRGSGWSSSNRVELVETSVAPGATGTFRFTYTVPSGQSPGTYREYFRPVADGIAWMEDWGIYWDIRVLSQAESYRAQWTSQNAYPTLNRGNSYQFEVQFRNSGLATWPKGTVNLGTDRDRDRVPQFTRADIPSGNPSGWISSNRVELVETSVAPGATGTFRFYYTVPSGQSPGTYREYFRPVADGIAWMDDWGMYWDININ